MKKERFKCKIKNSEFSDSQLFIISSQNSFTENESNFYKFAFEYTLTLTEINKSISLKRVCVQNFTTRKFPYQFFVVCKQNIQRLVPNKIILWLFFLFQVLNHLHQNDIIYRDVKSSNFILSPNGDIKLVDYGINYISCSLICIIYFI